MNPEINTICWSCGKPVGLCICGSDSQPITIKKPTEVLPFCSTDAPEYLGGLIERPCCVCGKSWLCDRDEWINGKCPNCGATGSNHKILPIIKAKIVNKELLKLKKEFENKEKLHLDLE